MNYYFCFMLMVRLKQPSMIYFLFAHDSSLSYQRSNIETIEKQLDRYLAIFYKRFVDNKLSIHFGKGKTKRKLFTSKKYKKVERLFITYERI